MACDYLAVQESSVPSEQVFLEAGFMDSKHRQSFLPENFGAVQTVKGRYKHERHMRKRSEDDAHAAQRLCWLNDDIAQSEKMLVA